ncbi:MAG: CCA tRNA nucleotidyltransferase [Nitrospinae bacterium]|nr:CCA tRNA nucleotidyltransferase [Nitrospinota bacterium]
MKEISRERLINTPFIREIWEVSQRTGIKVYLVGGGLRDMIMEREGYDLDFAVDGDALIFGRKVADAIGEHYFPLDEERSTSRVIVKRDAIGGELDFSRLRGKGIEDDLRARDFTINSMAINLDDIFCGREEIPLIDPLKGLDDLERGCIRSADHTLLIQDPLRMIRAVRLSATLNLSIGEELREFIIMRSESILSISIERIRDELFKILSVDRPHSYINELKTLNLLTCIFPEIESMERIDEGLDHRYHLWQHSLNTLSCLEVILLNLQRFFPDNYQEVGSHLSKETEYQIKRRELLKFTSLFHDIGRSFIRPFNPFEQVERDEDIGVELNTKISKRIRLGGLSRKVVRKITLSHMRPIKISRGKGVGEGDIYRYWRDTGEEGIETCILAIADAEAIRGADHTDNDPIDIMGLGRQMISYYFEVFSDKAKPILSGRDLIDKFGLIPGPLLGMILKKVEDAKGDGIITNREDALMFIKKELPFFGEKKSNV